MNEQMNRYFPIDWTDEEQAFAKSIQKELGQPEDGLATEVMPVPTGVEVGASSDVGDVSWNVPTMGAVYSAWPKHVPAHHWGATACHGMSIGRRATLHAAKVLAATGLDVLTEPNLLKAIRDEFDKQKAGTEYKSLCDSKTNPQGNLSDPDIEHYECCIHAAEEHYGIKGPLS
jgi:aminobenzoyl-glutamate utilization protein B